MTNKSVRPLYQPAQTVRVFIQSKPLLKVGRLVIFHVNMCTNLRVTRKALQASLCRWSGDCSVIYGSSPAHYSKGPHNSFISVSKCIWLDRIIIHIITRTHTWTCAFVMDIGFEIPGHHSVHSCALQSHISQCPPHSLPHTQYWNSDLWWLFYSIWYLRCCTCLKCPVVEEKALTLWSLATLLFVVNLTFYFTFEADFIFGLFYAYHCIKNKQGQN